MSRRRISITPADLRTVLARLESGDTMIACANALGTSETTLRSRLVEAGMLIPAPCSVRRVDINRSAHLNPIVPPALPDTRDLTGYLFNDPTPAQRAARALANEAGI